MIGALAGRLAARNPGLVSAASQGVGMAAFEAARQFASGHNPLRSLAGGLIDLGVSTPFNYAAQRAGITGAPAQLVDVLASEVVAPRVEEFIFKDKKKAQQQHAQQQMIEEEMLERLVHQRLLAGQYAPDMSSLM